MRYDTRPGWAASSASTWLDLSWGTLRRLSLTSTLSWIEPKPRREWRGLDESQIQLQDLSEGQGLEGIKKTEMRNSMHLADYDRTQPQHARA